MVKDTLPFVAFKTLALALNIILLFSPLSEVVLKAVS